MIKYDRVFTCLHNSSVRPIRHFFLIPLRRRIRQILLHYIIAKNTSLSKRSRAHLSSRHQDFTHLSAGGEVQGQDLPSAVDEREVVHSVERLEAVVSGGTDILKNENLSLAIRHRSIRSRLFYDSVSRPTHGSTFSIAE